MENKLFKVIKTEAQYEMALSRIEKLMDISPALGTNEGDELELLLLLIKNYEDEHYKIDLPDPVEAIKYTMEQQELTQRDLIPVIGSRVKVSEVLNRKRPLTLKMIRALNQILNIPAEVLLNEKNAFSINCLIYGIQKPKNTKPPSILTGNATINIFICGTVLATSPKETLVNNSATIKGPPILTAIINIPPNNFDI